MFGHCAQCGSVFEKDRQKTQFCSRACLGKHQLKPFRSAPVACENCGNAFFKRDEQSRFCCYECRKSAVKSGLIVIRRRPPGPRFSFTCLYCREPFLVSTNGTFSQKHRKTRKRFYCSNDCRIKDSKKEKHPCWQGGKQLWNYQGYRGSNWIKQRNLALKRDKNRCQNPGCENPERNGKKWLAVHHIIPYWNFPSWKEANRLKNLVTLCQSCHMTEESKVKEKQGMLFFGQLQLTKKEKTNRGKSGVLESPKGTVYPFKNLRRFVRNNPHLFSSSDLIEKRGVTVAADRLRKLFLKKNPRKSWKGWKRHESLLAAAVPEGIAHDFIR